MTTLSDQLISFVEVLRGRGVRVSIGETMDALNGVVAVGLERRPMRKALAATLIKDEGDRPAFDDAFAAFFNAPGAEAGEPRQGTSRDRLEGRGRGDSTVEAPSQPDQESEARRGARPSSPEEKSEGHEPESLRDDRVPQHDAESGAPDQSAREDRGESEDRAGDGGIEAERHARLRAAERKPFTQYSDLDYDLAREALKPLLRRFRVRVGRRFRIAHRGRIDFRRTIRASTQRGGALVDLRFRSRRPRHIDLLILADISGSVRYSSTLMLELIAGARQCFRRVTSFVYIDRLAEADFEDHHLVMTPPLDLYARSDFGRVLNEIWRRREELLGRATLLVIMGDGRNNRRPARADLLRDIGRLCSAVLWLNPEQPHRWGTGDSAIRIYEREVSAMLPACNLRELEACLSRVA